MELLFLLQITAITFSAFFFIYKFLGPIRTRSQTPNAPPEPPGAWPVIGHLPLLGGQTPVYRTLGAITDEQGPVFTVKLGTRRALVVSGREAVKELYTINDSIFIQRPLSLASKYVAYGPALFGFGRFGEYWRDIRKIVTLKLLSNRCLDNFAGVRNSELETSIRQLWSGTGDKVVDLTSWLSLSAMNVMVRMVSGKNGATENDGDNSARRFAEALREAMYLSGLILVGDFIPGIGCVDFGGHVRRMKRNAKELDKIMSEWLKEHVTKRNNGSNDEQDFMDAMLTSVSDGSSQYEYSTETVVKATALNLVLGGADTTFVALTWVFSLLLNHRGALTRLQDELDRHVGRKRWVEESDIKNLTFLQAVIKETLRLYPPGPLTSRESMENCSLSGYHVPKGTIVFINLWKLHRDPTVWAEPDEFRPERFLSGPQADVDFRGQHFEFIPFSSGRKACPGTSLAVRMVSLTVARVLQGFDVATPGDEAVEMKEGLGLTMPQLTPLKVLLKPRLGNELYML